MVVSRSQHGRKPGVTEAKASAVWAWCCEGGDIFSKVAFDAFSFGQCSNKGVVESIADRSVCIFAAASTPQRRCQDNGISTVSNPLYMTTICREWTVLKSRNQSPLIVLDRTNSRETVQRMTWPIGFGDNTDLLWWNNVNNQFCQLTTRVSYQRGIRRPFECTRNHTYWGLKNNWGM